MLSHLLELRRIAMRSLMCYCGFFLLLYIFSNELFHALVNPLLHTLPNQDGLIATQITSSVLTPLKLAANAALLFTAPVALFFFWQFISPGLYKNEQVQLRGAVVLSLGLFAIGVLFCYFLVLPFMFQFFAQALPEGVRLMPDMAYAMDFITRMLFLFGLSFQVPLICLLLVRIKVIDVMTLRTVRPYVIVSAFIVGMLLTPPDVFSQVMLAVPLCLLYELGIVLAVYLS